MNNEIKIANVNHSISKISDTVAKTFIKFKNH